MKAKNNSQSDLRGRIIEGVFLAAAKNGFAGATTKEIAREAKCSEGIIYHYFKNKHELCLEMIREYSAEFRKQALWRIERIERAKDKLEELVSFQLDYFTREGNIFQLLFGKSGDGTVSMRQILKIAVIPYARIIEGVIKDGIRDKELRGVNPEVAAVALLGMLQLNILKMHFGLGDFSKREIKEGIEAILFKGISVAL